MTAPVIEMVSAIQPVNGVGTAAISFSNLSDGPISTTLPLTTVISDRLYWGTGSSGSYIPRMESGITTLTVDAGNSDNVTAGTAVYRWTRMGTRYEGDLVGSITATAAAPTASNLRISALPGIASNFAAVTDVWGSGARFGSANNPDQLSAWAIAAAQTVDLDFNANSTGAREYHCYLAYDAN